MKWRNAADKHAAGAEPAAREEPLHLALAELSKHFNGLFFPPAPNANIRKQEGGDCMVGFRRFLRGEGGGGSDEVAPAPACSITNDQICCFCPVQSFTSTAGMSSATLRCCWEP